MGTLYVVATPIGNLEDITLRALRVLREVPLIAAEDTRHTRKLLNHFGITTRAISYHQHSPAARVEAIVAALAQGDVALVTDAGMPGISDPGQPLVAAALAAGYPVVPVPGPTAVIAALAASGLPSDEFTFLGFLPRRGVERREMLAGVRALPHTVICYEAPHRLLACLDDLIAMLGDRPAALARELTKLHEEVRRGSLTELRAAVEGSGGPRGEYTVLIAGAPASAGPAIAPEAAVRERLGALLAGGASTRDAARRVADELGVSRREAYRRALMLSPHERR
jgi:16S rRNA (cytidine1402-2'-O)-methyltransferase